MKKLLFILIFFTSTLVFGFSNSDFSVLIDKNLQVTQGTPTLSEIVASPNPFSIKTTISFISEKDQEVTLTVKNLLGKNVYLEKLDIQKGENKFDFYKNNLSPGMYLYSLQTSHEIISKRLVIK